MFKTAFLDLPPLRSVAGTVRLPGSKSISNRALLLAGFGAGTTTLAGLLASDDTMVMLDALVRLGCDVRAEGDDLRITGIAGRPGPCPAPIFLGNAGTAMRPLAAALALAGAGSGDGAGPGAEHAEQAASAEHAVAAAAQPSRGGSLPSYELRGSPRMHERPIGDLVDALRALGADVACLENEGYPPLRIVPADRLALAAPIRVRGDVSSQFLTALLLALPLRADPRPAVIEVEGELISKPYIEITLRLLAAFGVVVERDGWQRFRLPAGAAPRSPGPLRIEGDASSASYLIAAAAIAAVDAPLRIEGVGSGSTQGDLAFVDAVRAMGATVELEADAIEVRRGEWPLRPIELDCNAFPDAAMTLAALALFARGTSRLANIASWRVKETDRLAAMATELRKLGAAVVEGADFIEIAPPDTWRAATVATYDDHRMAMALSLAAFNGLCHGGATGEAATDGAAAGGTGTGGAMTGVAQPVRILDPGCVAKTYPGYFETLFSIARALPRAIPVLAVDGPTASGKGTLAGAVARALGYRLLDSGACYRAAALAALLAGLDATDQAALVDLTTSLDLHFEGERTFLGGRDVSESLRLEAVGAMASRISAWPGVRAALLEVQLAFRGLPGLVADGRDMGTVVFPDADLKIFLVAGTAERAERRHRQLMAAGITARLEDLRADLEARDARDMNRSASPLKPAEDAMLLDNSALSIEASMAKVLEAWERRRPFGSVASRALPAAGQS